MILTKQSSHSGPDDHSEIVLFKYLNKLSDALQINARIWSRGIQNPVFICSILRTASLEISLVGTGWANFYCFHVESGKKQFIGAWLLQNWNVRGFWTLDRETACFKLVIGAQNDRKTHHLRVHDKFGNFEEFISDALVWFCYCDTPYCEWWQKRKI